jgi:hypothetical protein
MKKVFTVLFLYATFFFAQAQNSDSLTGPKVWLRADQSELNSGKWNDVSFFKNHAAPLAPTSMPVEYASINFNKVTVFDGIDDQLKLPYSFEGDAELSVFAVFESSDTVERGIWGTQQALSRPMFLTTRRVLGPNAITDLYGKHEKLPMMSTVVQNWDKVSETSTNAFVSLGSAGSTTYKPFAGKLAELIVFNRALSFLERIQYETYLAIKYGTGLKEGNAISSDGKLLWHVEQNSAFNKHLAGIGRDDFFNLYQKQSGSAYDSGLLLMNVGALAKSNPENTSLITNQDFIIWGDNGLPLSMKPGQGRDSIVLFVQRKWMVTASGTTANKQAVQIQIDAAKFPDPMGYWLVIDRSGTGNFSIDNLEYFTADRLENGRIIFKDIKWDADGSGKDAFGFVRKRNLLTVVRKLNDPSCTNELAGKVRIEVVAGKAPFRYALKNTDATISREWKQSTTSIEQKDLGKGDYVLSVKDGANETLERKFTLVMPDALTISLGSDQKFPTTDPIVLNVTSQVPENIPVTYRWENSFGFSSEKESVTVTEPAVYKVYVTKESDGCVFTDDIAITGASEQRVAVYPTIVRGDEMFNVGISLERPSPVVVQIMTSSGLLLEKSNGTGNSEYQFTYIAKNPGLYLVVIQTPKGIETRKIVVQ